MSALDIIGWIVGFLGIAATFLTYSWGKAAGRKETERSIRLDSLTSIRREIIEARQAFNDWFAPITTSTGWTADPAMAQEVGKKVDAINTTYRAIRNHLTLTQRVATENLVSKFGNDYLEFSFACKRHYPDEQKQKAKEVRQWFAGELETTLNEILTER